MEARTAIASTMESYLLRDVCKIVWDYFSGGVENVVYGRPIFELRVAQSSSSYCYLYENGHFQSMPWLNAESRKSVV